MRSRLALLAVAALAGLALTACQHDPNVAATVGSEKITEDQVDAILADAQNNRPQPQVTQATPSPAPLGPVQIDRADVVRVLVLGKMCAADQARRHFPSGEPSTVAPQKQISPNSQYAKAFGTATACLRGAVSDAKPATPTDAEVRDLYDRAASQGVDVPAFDEIKDQLKTNEQVQGLFGVKRALEGEAQVQKVSVSPRYRPVELGLQATSAPPPACQENPETAGCPVLFEGPQLIVAMLGQSNDAIQSA